MLLLQRRIGESIYIGDDIKITVLDATGRQVRLGIQAPRDVSVHREEIYHRIQQEKSTQQHGDGDDQENASNDVPRPASQRPRQQPSQIRYRSANPYRKNSPSYRKNDGHNDSLGNIAQPTDRTDGNYNTDD